MRFVDYKLTEEDVNKSVGGNTPSIGDVFPMLVTKDWSNGAVNGRVFLDGPTILWVTSSRQGDEPGNWQPAT